MVGDDEPGGAADELGLAGLRGVWKLNSGAGSDMGSFRWNPGGRSTNGILGHTARDGRYAGEPFIAAARAHYRRAGALIVVIPVIVLFIAAQRYFVNGLMGAVKA